MEMNEFVKRLKALDVKHVNVFKNEGIGAKSVTIMLGTEAHEEFNNADITIDRDKHPEITHAESIRDEINIALNRLEAFIQKHRQENVMYKEKE